MTTMAAEAGDAAVESQASDSAAAGRKVTGDRYDYRRPENAQRLAPGRGQPRQHRAARAVATVAAPEESVAARAVSRRSSTRQGGSQRRGGGKPESLQRFPGGGTPTRSNYHGALLAEWAVGSLLIIAIPFSKPNQTGVSPYAGRDLVQLGTYTVVFWLLAIFAATGRTQARFAAWFGGLILLAVGLAEAGSIATAVKSWLGGGTTASTQTSSAGTSTQTTGNPSVVNAPSTETATGIARAVAQAPGNGLT